MESRARGSAVVVMLAVLLLGTGSGLSLATVMVSVMFPVNCGVTEMVNVVALPMPKLLAVPVRTLPLVVRIQGEEMVAERSATVAGRVLVRVALGAGKGPLLKIGRAHV